MSQNTQKKTCLAYILQPTFYAIQDFLILSNLLAKDKLAVDFVSPLSQGEHQGPRTNLPEGSNLQV